MYDSKNTTPSVSGSPSVEAVKSVRFLQDYRFEKLHQRHASAYLDHLLRLDNQARLLRFGTTVNDHYITNYAEKLGTPGVTIVGCFKNRQLCAVAELHEYGPWWSRQAEVAFSVDQSERHHGLGDSLFERISLTARNHWIKKLHLTCMANNQNMRHIAEHHRLRLSQAGNMIEGDIKLLPPTPISILTEILGASPEQCSVNKQAQVESDDQPNFMSITDRPTIE